MIPRLDHHVGKIVETVDSKGKSTAWNIHFEDGTVVTSHKKAPKPPVEGLRLMLVESFTSRSGRKFLRMHFNKPNSSEEVIEVEEGTYEINGEDPHAKVETDIPPDPSVERVQDQPEGGWNGSEE